MKSFLLSLTFLCVVTMSFAQDGPTPAQDLLTSAYQRAEKENKNVMVIFHASWCGWCRKMEAAINDDDCKKLFDKNYVIVYLTVEESKDKKDLENPGADLVKKKYLGEKAGLPFWLILDKNGNMLGDSYIRKAGMSKSEPGENVGCPASEKEVEVFIDLLRKSSSLSEKQLEKIAKRFLKNKPATAN